MRFKSSINKLKILLALIFVFQGMSIAFLGHPVLKISPWLRLGGVALMLGGLFYLYFHYKRIQARKDVEPEPPVRLSRGRLERVQARSFDRASRTKAEDMEAPVSVSIVTRIMSKMTKSAKDLSYLTLPIAGALIIDAVFIYNFVTGQGLALKSWDTITVMLGASLILYNFIPESYSVTRDFMVFFLTLLFIILVLPQLFYTNFIGAEASAYYTKILLADPVVALLKLFGIESFTVIEKIPGSTYTAVVHYGMANGEMQQVGITESCSGIYTTSIFISAFITYILVEYHQINRKVVLILILGVFTSYLANILRMTIITGIGHYYGTEALLDAHANAGWLIFLAWIIPFWFLVFKYLIKEEPEELSASSG